MHARARLLSEVQLLCPQPRVGVSETLPGIQPPLSPCGGQPECLKSGLSPEPCTGCGRRGDGQAPPQPQPRQHMTTAPGQPPFSRNLFILSFYNTSPCPHVGQSILVLWGGTGTEPLPEDQVPAPALPRQVGFTIKTFSCFVCCVDGAAGPAWLLGVGIRGQGPGQPRMLWLMMPHPGPGGTGTARPGGSQPESPGAAVAQLQLPGLKAVLRVPWAMRGLRSLASRLAAQGQLDEAQ